MVSAIFAMNASLERWGLPPEVLHLTRPYLAVLTWSLPPLPFYVAFRRYLQAMNVVRPVMSALVAANVVNAIANWILIYGRFGAPAMGVRGSAYATLVARIFMAGWLLIVILRPEAHGTPGLLDTPSGIDLPRLRRLFALRLPAAGPAGLVGGCASSCPRAWCG